jgi:hypothetical protein
MKEYFFRDGEKVQYKVFDDNGKLHANRYCGKCGGTGMTGYYWVHAGVCFKCDGTKIDPTPRRVFTKEELDRLNKNAEVRLEKRMAKIKFGHYWKSFNERVEFKSWREIKKSKYLACVKTGFSLEILESKTKDFWVKVKSEFVELGNYVKELTLVFRHGFETQYGYSEIYKFVDDQSNQYVWFTSSYPKLEKGQTYNAKFIVKDNQESEEYGKQNMIKNFKIVKESA